MALKNDDSLRMAVPLFLRMAFSLNERAVYSKLHESWLWYKDPVQELGIMSCMTIRYGGVLTFNSIKNRKTYQQWPFNSPLTKHENVENIMMPRQMLFCKGKYFDMKKAHARKLSILYAKKQKYEIFQYSSDLKKNREIQKL